jgi:hypothetical protein
MLIRNCLDEVESKAKKILGNQNLQQTLWEKEVSGKEEEDATPNVCAPKGNSQVCPIMSVVC